ncbi:HNH endonuclease signature motif containing protein [Paraburkholderia heleia]|uniref:HNH endonuclease signature motif containing protein n=1 Tax=Paraburkholderia heleia TaxID=634127 RepID=UPI000A0040B2|nr:HNH endonuclease signature motif containing protein [Paraburkholderia heleia]
MEASWTPPNAENNVAFASVRQIAWELLESINWYKAFAERNLRLPLLWPPLKRIAAGRISYSSEHAMATHRTNVGAVIKNTLRNQAGGKCANPGCPNTRTHIHHIKEWAVYQTHDEKDMIAVCPTCHDAIHHGRLKISDETLYQWKGVPREDQSRTGHVYVEPGGERKLLLGSLAVTATSSVLAFSLSPGSFVNLTLDDDLTLIDLKLSSVRGDEIVRIAKSGHFKATAHADVTFASRPGALRLTAPCSPEFIPDWLIWAINAEDREFIHNPVTLLSVEVVEPGLIRLEGVWAVGGNAVVVSRDKLQFFTRGAPRPLTLIGDGKESVFKAKGEVAINELPLFAFGTRK